jgi:hypothetical protein
LDGIVAAAARSDLLLGPKMTESFIEDRMKRTAQFRSSMYVSCWRLGARESDAMWRLEFEYENEARIVTWRRGPGKRFDTDGPQEVRDVVSRISPGLESRIQSSSMGHGPYL